MEELRWERLRKVLGRKPRRVTQKVFQRFIQEGETLNITKIIPDLKSVCRPYALGRLSQVYSQSNPDVKIIWEVQLRSGIMKNKWKTNLQFSLKRSGDKSFKIENSRNAMKRVPYL